MVGVTSRRTSWNRSTSRRLRVWHESSARTTSSALSGRRSVDDHAQHRVDLLPDRGAHDVGVRPQVVDARQGEPLVDRVLVEHRCRPPRPRRRDRPARRRRARTASAPPRRSPRSRAWATRRPGSAVAGRRVRPATTPPAGAATAGPWDQVRPPPRAPPPDRRSAGPWVPWSTGGASRGPRPHRRGPGRATAFSPYSPQARRRDAERPAAVRAGGERDHARGDGRGRLPPTSHRPCGRGSTDCWWSRTAGCRCRPSSPSSGVLVLPTTTHPAATSRATSAESSVAGGSSA